MSSAVISPAQPEQILKGLGKLWTSLGEEEKQQGKPTVLRACAMTLIVATDEADSGFFAAQTISELMREHPSRGIVLSVSPEEKEDLEARVLAQCWKPFGKAQQICCEQIELKTRPEGWATVSPVLVGLAAADLPVILWCRHRAALDPAKHDQRRGLEEVMNLATKIIFDTENLDARSVFEILGKWKTQGRIIADLEWTRLTPWREPIGHLFDNVSRENGFSNFHSFEVAHADEKPTVEVLYIAGWLSAPFKRPVTFKRTEGHGPGLHSVTMRSDTETITFERTGPECMTISSTNGRSRRYGYTEASITSLMTEELSLLGSDPAFDSAFARAAELLS